MDEHLCLSPQHYGMVRLRPRVRFRCSTFNKRASSVTPSRIIVLAAKAFEDKSIGFYVCRGHLDVPMLAGEFAAWNPACSCYPYSNLANLTGTGRDSSLLHGGITHEYATYSDGHAAFYKQLSASVEAGIHRGQASFTSLKLYRTSSWVGAMNG